MIETATPTIEDLGPTQADSRRVYRAGGAIQIYPTSRGTWTVHSAKKIRQGGTWTSNRFQRTGLSVQELDVILGDAVAWLFED